MYKFKILFIDDDKVTRDNLKELLELDEFLVFTADNGIDGLLLCETEQPDIVICDIMMPEMSGDEFYTELKKREISETPFIFLTAKDSLKDIRERMNRGADDYLIKPIKYDDLLDAIRVRFVRREEIVYPYQRTLDLLTKSLSLVSNFEFQKLIQKISNEFFDLSKLSEKAPKNHSYESAIKCFEELNNLLGKLRVTSTILSDVNQKFETKNYSIRYLIEDIISQVLNDNLRPDDFSLVIENEINLFTNKNLFQYAIKQILELVIKHSEQGNRISIGITSMKENISIIFIPAYKLEVDSGIFENYEIKSGMDYTAFFKKNNVNIAITDIILTLINGKVLVLKSDERGYVFEVSILCKDVK